MAGVLALHEHPAAVVFALGPAAYAAYMLVQYVVGPQYSTYEPAVVLLVRAWALIDVLELPIRSRGWAVVVFLLAGFVWSRWAGALAGIVTTMLCQRHPRT